MPNLKKVWSSWNYLEGRNDNQLSVTYWMNKLQKLNTNLNIFVSLNPSILPSKEKIFKKIYYDHPLFDFKTFENDCWQRRLNAN